MLDVWSISERIGEKQNVFCFEGCERSLLRRFLILGAVSINKNKD